MKTKGRQEALEAAVGKVRRNAGRFGTSFPPDASTNRDYSPGLGGNAGWTAGFWSGLLWLAYQVTGWDDLRGLALTLGPTFDRRLRAGVGIDHDLGMLFMPSRALEYRLTAGRRAREAALEAASALAARFRESGGYIQAWGAPDDPAEAGRTIIDSMMNIPLLFWAGREARTAEFREKAIRHARTVGRYLIRGDGSSYHTFFFDPGSGQPVGGRTSQGHADGSTWARGQAWGVYGFTLAYRWSGDPLFLEHARRLAGYFLAHLPEDGVCYWDLDLSRSGQPRDTSAAAIAACGLLELSPCLPEAEGGRYREAASSIVERLAAGYQAPPEKEGLLAEAVADLPRGRGVRESTLYGDYFYLEALVRLGGGDAVLPWL